MSKKKLFRAEILGENPIISEIQIEKETTSSVWFINEKGKEICERKVSTNISFHDSYADAKGHLFRSQTSTVRDTEKRLQYENGILAEIQSL